MRHANRESMTGHSGRGKMLLAASVALVLLVASSAIWWKDEPLSDETGGLLRPSTVAAHDNAYFSLLGFNSPAEKNPDELGRQAVARYQTELTLATIPAEAGWPNTLLAEAGGLHFSENVLSSCIKDGVADIACVINNRTSIEEALKRNPILLERYLGLLQYPKYANPAPGGIGFLIPPFTEIQRAKLALWAKAILQAQDGRTTEALGLLQKDVRFWRMLSAQADSLLTRMIAVAMLHMQYELLSQMIAYFPGLVAQDRDTLLQMARPFSAPELSFRNALAGELRVTA